MIRQLAIFLLSALAVAALVHRPLFSHEFSGPDMISIAQADGTQSGFFTKEVIRTGVIRSIETAVLGDNPRIWGIVGWLLLGLTAASWGQVAQTLAHKYSGGSLSQSPGIWTAVILAALPLGYELLASPSGHVGLWGALICAFTLRSAVRWPGTMTWVCAPSILGLCFLGTVGSCFFLLAPILIYTKAAPEQPRKLRQAATTCGILGLLFGFWSLTAMAPDAAQGASGRLSLADTLQSLFYPASMGDGYGWAFWVSASFAASLLSLGVGGHIAARGMGRPTALVGVLWTALVLVLGACGALAGQSLLPAASILIAGLGIALSAGVAAAALSRTSVGWMAPLALFVVLAGTASLSVRQQVGLRSVAADSTELNAVLEQLRSVRSKGAIADEIVIFGLDSGSDPHLGATLVASQSPPFADSTSIPLRTIPSGSHQEPLLAASGQTLVLDWRPANLTSVSTRPRGWALSPLLLTGAPDSNTPVQLITPKPDATRILKRPTSLEEDMTFAFKVKSACLRTHEIVFYGAYAGGFNPKGKQQLIARHLTPSVLTAEQHEGWTTIHWRTSIRPGPGQDGIRFEDPDLDLSGKTLHWTVGLIPKEDVCETDQHHHESHAGHSYASPTDIAHPRRLHCVNP